MNNFTELFILIFLQNYKIILLKVHRFQNKCLKGF
jgi:hypothetical protein